MPRMSNKRANELLRKFPILQYFQYNHLPEPLRKISAPYCTLAWKMADQFPTEYPEIAEATVALRKLLESKDAAVRAMLPKLLGEMVG